jgi:hypothetical protein
LATLVSKVRGISGSSTTITSNSKVVEYLKGGAGFTITGIPTALLAFAATNSTNIVTSTGYSVTTEKIFSVRRNGIECRRQPLEQDYANQAVLVSSTSLFKASAIHPKYVMRGALVFIRPNPTTAAIGVISRVVIPTIATNTSNTVLDEVENPMILFAASQDCMAMAEFWAVQALQDVHAASTSLGTLAHSTTEASDALDKAQYLIDNSTELTAGQDAEYYINTEDTEMFGGIRDVAAQELGRARTHLERFQLALSNANVSRDVANLVYRLRASATAGQSVIYVQKAQQLYNEAVQQVDYYVQRNDSMIRLNASVQASQSRRSS